MLLFPSQKDHPTLKKQEKTFYVLSARPEVNQQLSQMLKLIGYHQVEYIQQDFNSVKRLELVDSASGIIVDIGSHEQADVIQFTLRALIPRHIWYCVVGDSDSIRLAQALARYQITYFNLATQLDLLLQSIASGMSNNPKNLAVTACILGCKGGVGNSTIGYHLANEVVKIRQVPTLLVQGPSGSHDLDLLPGKKISSSTTGIFTVDKNLDLLKSAQENFLNYDQETLQKYNFILFEHSIINIEKEALHLLIEQMYCLILVIDRSLASIRVARTVIETLELLQRTQNISRRLLICLNDSRPISSHMLTKEEISSLLQKAPDIVFPYVKNSKFTTYKHYSHTVHLLAQRILGREKPAKWYSLKRLQQYIPLGK